MARKLSLVAVSLLVACSGSDASSPEAASPVEEPTSAEATGPVEVATTVEEATSVEDVTDAATSAAPQTMALRSLADGPLVMPAEGESFTNPGAVVEIDGTLHLLRNSFTRWPGPSVVHHLQSGDRGLTWELAAPEPVLVSADVPYARQTAFVTSALVAEDGTWIAYLYTYDGRLNDAVIGRATAPGPGGPWAVDDDPVLAPGSPSAWDGVRLAEPSVVRSDDGYLMWYVGFGTGQISAIGLATSPDGVTWTKHDAPTTTDESRVGSDPVLVGEQDWTGGAIDGPQVVWHDGRYLMTHTASAPRAFAIGLATSADGETWAASDANPLLTRDDVGEPFFQSELFLAGEDVRFLLEIGPGTSATALHLFELEVTPA